MARTVSLQDEFCTLYGVLAMPRASEISKVSVSISRIWGACGLAALSYLEFNATPNATWCVARLEYLYGEANSKPSQR
jgi:hypothetical protein